MCLLELFSALFGILENYCLAISPYLSDDTITEQKLYFTFNIDHSCGVFFTHWLQQAYNAVLPWKFRLQQLRKS